MECPIGHKQLKLIEKNGITGYHCAYCCGVFLPGRYVKAFKHNYQTEILNKKIELNIPSIQSLKCPACHHPLQLKYLDGIELDCCQHCNGIWFDKNELDYLIRRHGQKPNSLGEQLAVYIGGFLGGLWG